MRKAPILIFTDLRYVGDFKETVFSGDGRLGDFTNKLTAAAKWHGTFDITLGIEFIISLKKKIR